MAIYSWWELAIGAAVWGAAYVFGIYLAIKFMDWWYGND